jgi:creatinine amidohydrolase
MKPPTVFLSEMTNRELEQFLQKATTVLIPIGATEQHGPHSALGTDVFIPQELCRRAAPQIPAVVGPALSYGLSYAHRGFKGELSLSIDTFMNVITDLCITYAAAGFRKLVFVNGHYDNTYAIAFGCARAAERLPEGTRAFPLTYWEGLPPERAREFLGGDKGLHANVGEVSTLLAINPDLVDMSLANAEMPSFPSYKTSAGGHHTAYFLTNPGSLYRITRSGTWGDATQATAEKGRQFLQWGTEAVLSLLEDIDATFAHLPVR